MKTEAEKEKIEMMTRHAYHPYNNRFGLRVTGNTFEDRYASLEQKLAEQAEENARFKAAFIAFYN